LTLPAPAEVARGPATACFRAFATNAEGEESGPSNVACANFAVPTDPCITPPPTGLKTTLGTVYETYSLAGKTYLGASVGTAPIGTACLANSVTINGLVYYEVPISAVTLKRPPKSAVVTRCSTG
jgi:hypothetical protein